MKMKRLLENEEGLTNKAQEMVQKIVFEELSKGNFLNKDEMKSRIMGRIKAEYSKAPATAMKLYLDWLNDKL